MMRACWQEPYIMRPSFLDIVSDLEKTLENDRVSVQLANYNMKIRISIILKVVFTF